jgi:hypothetical protein
MKKQYRILQSPMSLCSEGTENNLVLVFMNHLEIEAVYIVPLPVWFNFYDPKYQYYPICLN